MASKAAEKVKICFLLTFVILCTRSGIPLISETKDHIIYVKRSKKADVVSSEIWIMNLSEETKDKLIQHSNYQCVSPEWLSDSEAIFMLNPRSSVKPIIAVMLNFKEQMIKNLKKWQLTNADAPFSLSGIKYTEGKIIYYSGFLLLSFDLKTGIVERVIPYKAKNKVQIKYIDKFDVIDMSDVVFSAQSPIQVAQARRTKFKKYCSDLYVYKDGVLEKTTFGDTIFSNEYPTWIGPDTLIFSSNLEGNYDLYIMDLKTKKVTRLTNTPGAEERETTVSPDHQKIVYVRYYPKRENPEKVTEIWLMDLKTKETHFLDYGDQPRWSPAK